MNKERYLKNTETSYTVAKPINTLFVSTFSDKHGAALSESLGPEALAGHLQGELRSSVQVDHIDLQLDPNIEDLTQKIVKEKPDIIGISVKIGALEQTRELVKALQSISSETGKDPLIVMGGVVPTFAASEMLQEFPEIIMSVKEGENAAIGLVEYLRGDRTLDQIPGIWYINDERSKMINTPEQRLDLRQRHLPARITSKRMYDELGGMIWAEGSRGCDFNCTFCSIRELHGGGFNGDIPPEKVVQDLANLNTMGINSVSFTDDDFGGDPERTAEIARLIKKNNVSMKFSISTRADHIWQERANFKGERLTDEELQNRNKRLREIMVDLRDAGLERVFIGMESGSPTQLKRYGKQVSVEGNYKALEILQELGIDVVAGYIPIDPAMNMTELQENLDFLRRTGMYKKITNPLSVLRIQRGSPYLKLAQHRGLVGEETKDLVFYKAKFEDLRVQKVADLADRWVEDMYVLMFGLKGEVASQTLLLGPGGESTLASKTVEGVLHNFRELEMEFIENITSNVLHNNSSDLEQITQVFSAKRNVLTEKVVNMVNSGILGKNPRLRDAIDQITTKK